MIQRNLEQKIEQRIARDKKEVIIIYGPRRVGKTTLARKLCDKYQGAYVDCTLRDVRSSLITMSSLEDFFAFIGQKKFIILDEAQLVPEIGQTLKLMHDHFPDVQVIATGSSSFELANQVGEPLFGRATWFHMYPLSVSEILGDNAPYTLKSQVDYLLRYGAMPSVFLEPDIREKEHMLQSISSSALYKDILMFEDIRKSNTISDLLRLLAVQLGNEVSYSELSESLSISYHTVAKYMDLLEKSFVIKVVRPLHKNIRKEIKRKVKVYFYDLGVRNALIQNFSPMDLRTDKGALWENFCILEFIKKHYVNDFYTIHFWRNHNQQEVDMVETKNGKYYAYEFKYSEKKQAKLPSDFKEIYPEHEFEVINTENFTKHFL